jgi:hypothetical protein
MRRGATSACADPPGQAALCRFCCSAPFLLANDPPNIYVALQQRLRRLFFGDDIQAFIAETGSA